MTCPEFTRRAFGGVTLAGVATPLLVACGSDGATPVDGDGESLVAASEVPVGGGVVIKGPDVVVTQPAEGDFKCFSAICTHQGCVVGSVSDGQIQCNCHGSVFSAEDGSVVNGPATTPLEEFPVVVTDGQVART